MSLNKSVYLFETTRGTSEYDACCIRVFAHYVKTHRSVSPYTATQEAFVSQLPEVAIYMPNFEAVAFIEHNEIAYLYGDNLHCIVEFVQTLLERLFVQYDRVYFEADDTDPVAMQFKMLFHETNTTFYGTYIKPWKIESE